ncbi:MAG: DUF465 domain-containing protein [Hyphomonadaceae bacterium]|nr:DUF465 domain-containing protein [Hyphomonadaceae bacterium]
MITAAHPAGLARRHAAIESDLASELKRPSPDFIRVKRLKQLKLAIKDKLVTLPAAQRAPS